MSWRFRISCASSPRPLPRPIHRPLRMGARYLRARRQRAVRSAIRQRSTTGLARSAALSNKAVNLFSDLLVHHMGPGLADDIVQGQAGPDEFRTAPLWGLGKRIFFL